MMKHKVKVKKPHQATVTVKHSKQKQKIEAEGTELKFCVR